MLARVDGIESHQQSRTMMARDFDDKLHQRASHCKMAGLARRRSHINAQPLSLTGAAAAGID